MALSRIRPRLGVLKSGLASSIFRLIKDLLAGSGAFYEGLGKWETKGTWIPRDGITVDVFFMPGFFSLFFSSVAFFTRCFPLLLLCV